MGDVRRTKNPQAYPLRDNIRETEELQSCSKLYIERLRAEKEAKRQLAVTIEKEHHDNINRFLALQSLCNQKGVNLTAYLLWEIAESEKEAKRQLAVTIEKEHLDNINRFLALKSLCNQKGVNLTAYLLWEIVESLNGKSNG